MPPSGPEGASHKLDLSPFSSGQNPLPRRDNDLTKSMPNDDATPPIGLLLSGGLDSSILLGHLLAHGRRVQPFYIRCQPRACPTAIR